MTDKNFVALEQMKQIYHTMQWTYATLKYHKKLLLMQ